MPHCKNCGRDFALGTVCPSCGAYYSKEATSVENSGDSSKEEEKKKDYSSNRAYNAMFVMYCLVTLIAITAYVVCAVTAVYFIRLHSASIIWTIVSVAMIGVSAILGLKVCFEFVTFYLYGFSEKDFLRVSAPSNLWKWMRKNVLPFVALVVLFTSIMPIITSVSGGVTTTHNINLMTNYAVIIVGAHIGYVVLECLLFILYNCLARDFLKSVYVGETKFRSFRVVRIKADKLYNYSNFQAEGNFLALTRKKVIRLLSALSSLALIVIIFISSINTLSFAQIRVGGAIKLGMAKSEVISLMGEPRSFASYDETDAEELKRRENLSYFTYYSGRVDFLRKKAIEYNRKIDNYLEFYKNDPVSLQNAYSSDTYRNLAKKYRNVNIKITERDYSTLSVEFNDIGQVISVRYDKQANKNIYPLERKKVKKMELSHKLTVEGVLSQEVLNRFFDWNKVWVNFEFTDGSYAYYYLDRVSYNDATGEVYFNDEWAKKCVLIKGVESNEK